MSPRLEKNRPVFMEAAMVVTGDRLHSRHGPLLREACLGSGDCGNDTGRADGMQGRRRKRISVDLQSLACVGCLVPS